MPFQISLQTILLYLSYKQIIQFLKAVFIHSLTAFGGPQGHMGMMMRTFVESRKDLTKGELMEYISFCQMLPGASSTQTLTLIGYKLGGVPLAVVTLLVWVMPASILMGILSFVVSEIGTENISTSIFRFIQSMVIGFIGYAAVKAFKISVNSLITSIIAIVSTLATFVFFKTPWIFPILIITGGIATNFSNKRIPKQELVNSKKIKWANMWLFIAIFLVAGYLSETARKNNWEDRKAYNLFENCYRFGSFVFGGGDVLIPMMLDQYVARPKAPKFLTGKQNIIKIEKNELLTGAGMVRAIPGPVFSIASFTGGLALESGGKHSQMLGCFVATIGIFLPSLLLVLFFYPVWQYLKRYAVIYRSLEGINAVVVGLMFGSTLYLLKDMFATNRYNILYINFIVIAATFIALISGKVPAPVIVLICLLLGWIF